ncbi:MAG TPA: hypothetical protein VI953_04330 [Candidatus Paceibacterota bacterium]
MSTYTPCAQDLARLLGVASDPQQVTKLAGTLTGICPRQAIDHLLKIFIARKGEEIALVVLATAARAMLFTGGQWERHGRRLTSELVCKAKLHPMNAKVAHVIQVVACESQALAESADLVLV